MKKYVLAALCILTALLPMAAMAGTIQMGTGGINTGDRVYFGQYVKGDKTYEVPWLVLNTNVDGFNYVNLFLLSEYLLGDSIFRTGTGYYKDSALNAKMDDLFNGTNTLFTTNEQDVIVIERNLNCADVDKGDDMNSPAVPVAHLYPLSYAEADKQVIWSKYGRTAKYIDDQSGNAGHWWLRSSQSEIESYGITGVGIGGDLTCAGFAFYEDSDESMGVRPAFNLCVNNDYIMISAAEGGKASEGMDKGLTEVGENLTDSWKLTLHDSDRELEAESISASGNELTIKYSEAMTGANEYISAIVEDNVSHNVTHYGRILSLKDSSEPSGTASIILPDNNAGKTLYVFNEQYNGDKMTDYFSTPIAIAYYAIKANPETLDFGSDNTGYSQPEAQTVTVKNIGVYSNTVTLPTLENYTVSAGTGFIGNTATLAAGETAAFTVQPIEGLGAGAYGGTLTVSGNNNTSDTVNVTFAVNAVPAIAGDTVLTLTKGYTAAETGAYTVTGYPAPTVTKTSGDAAITWNDTDKKLHIAAGLDGGAYPVTLTASNGVEPKAELSFTLTVNAAPAIAGDTALTLAKGYATTATGAYTVTGYPAPTVTKTSGDAALTWHDTDKKLRIAAGLDVGDYSVTLTANNGIAPDASFTFTLTVNAAPAPVAYYEIAAEPNDAAYGSVTGGGTYSEYSAVTLTAVANEGYHFAKWTEDGADAETANPLTFSAAANRTLTAVFDASANPPATENAIMGVITGQKYSVGDEVAFIAVGVGMDNDSPNPNDTRWLPTAWEANASGNFDTGYAQRFSTADMRAGTHTLSVAFTKQRFAGGIWENAVPAQTDTKSVDFILLSAPSAFGLDTLALKIGHSFDLKRLTGKSEGSWSMSDPIAKIGAKNILTPQKRGWAELIFTRADGGEKRVTLHVVKPEEEVGKVVPAVKKYILAVGDALIPEASVKPKSAAYPQLFWTAKNPDLLKDTGAGEFKALSVGQTVLLATATNGKTAEVKVIIADTPQSIALDRKKAALKKDETLTLTLKSYLPASLPAPSLTWTTSDKKVATVDENGTVTAHKKGKATITAQTKGGAKFKVKITVK